MGGDLVGPEFDDSAAVQNTIQKPMFLAHASKDPAGNDINELQLIKGWVAEDGRMHTTVLPIASATEGAASLCAVYRDQSFDAAQSAYYYLRVLEAPSPRWHTYDCEQLEMAWSSPIWFSAAR